MSEGQYSRASVVRVKGVSFNYLQFLWSQIGQIRQQQAAGNFKGAMALCVSFISYLPDSMKDKFRAKAEHIYMVMNAIQAGNLEQIQEIPDYYIRGIYKNRLLQFYSSEALKTFIDEMTSMLNQLGYMENLKVVAEGDLEGDQDWIPEQQRRQKAERRKRRKEKKEPQGNID